MPLLELFSKVLNMSLTASAVIGIVLIARLLLRKSPKSFSYALWAVVLFRLLCPVSLPSPVSLLGLFDAPVAEAGAVVSRVAYVSAEPESYREIILPTPVRTEVPEASEPRQAQQSEPEPQKKSVSAAEIAACIWATGMAVMLLLGIGSELRFRKHLTGACRLKGNIYLADHIDSAFVAGLVFPKIYLPSDLPEQQMDYIIAHEQYHVRRLDPVAKHLAFAALCIHWFNPLVWAAFILSGKDMEMSCDEAVVKKLGEGIRADYAASLLQLAMGRRIIASSPLAFGEGDTSGRIKNMANWKKPKKWVSAVSFAVCAVILTACAANPEKNVVVSKNDGAFDANVAQSATENQDPDTPQTVSYHEVFTSTDGSVEFSIDIDEEITALPMPVVKVEPHYLTGEEAQRVSQVLFPDAVFYEQGPWLYEVFTKSELQRKLNLITPYTNAGKMKELYTDSPESNVDVVKKFVELFSEDYQTAPEENPYGLCRWTFQDEAYYFYSEEDIQSRGLSELSEGVQKICARTQIDGIPYSFVANTRVDGPYQLNSFRSRIDSGRGPLSLENDVFMAQLCRTEPTQDQMKAVKKKVEQMLADMALGEWYVDECYVEVHSSEIWGITQDEYVICVNAVPVINGIPVVRREDLGSLKSTETYASHYNLTDAHFEFAANGELIIFQLDSTIDITETVNNNVAVLGLDELMERAKNHLSLSDSGAYSLPQEILEAYQENYGEEIVCKINISGLEYGLTRVKVPNTDTAYYYVPALFLSGPKVYCGRDSGTVYEEWWDQPVKHLLCLNAVDGTVIALSNE